MILALGGLVLFIYAYPGQMSEDAFEYLRQARTRFFTDRHPPAISALWRYLELVVAGPTGMLLLQSATLLLGGFAILKRTFSPHAAAWAACALIVFPPVMAAVAAISTHALMAGLLALGTGALLTESRRVNFAGLGALLAATALQPSALIATLPIILVLFSWRPVDRGIRRAVQALAAWLVITAAAAGINAFHAKQPMQVWHSTLAVKDVTGTLALAGADAEAAADVNLWPFGPDGSPPPSAGREALARAAKALALEHPLAYLRHRLAVFGALLWLDARHPELAVPPRALPEVALRSGIPTRSSELQDALTAALRALAEHTPLFAPWIYLALALALLPLARGHRDLLALLISGLTFEASLLVTATSPAYPRSLWLLACTCISIIVLVARRARA